MPAVLRYLNMGKTNTEATAMQLVPLNSSQKIHNFNMRPTLVRRDHQNVNKLEEWLDVVVTIVCWLTLALVVFLQEDEDVPSVYLNLKIFCETAR